MTDELEPCPFCGSKRVAGVTISNRSRIFREYACCEDCGASTTTYETKQEAVDAWNARHKRTCKWTPHKYNWENGRWLTECGQDLVGMDDILPKYCPSCGGIVCGAEVVDGD